MLSRLKIENYALIAALELEFGEGLTIITGETGAGKSIMLGALSLLLGGRADTRVISDGSVKSVVEAEFVDVDPSLQSLFDEKGVSWEQEEGSATIIIRREISAAGKSRVFVNGCAVTIATLSAISTRLIDIHSQHANAKLNSAAEQLHIVDEMADNSALVAEYRDAFSKYLVLRRRIARLKENIARSRENEGKLRYELELLDKLNPQRGELANIELRYDILSEADELKERFAALMALIGPNGAQGMVTEALGIADKYGNAIDNAINGETDIYARLNSVAIELKDLAGAVEDAAEEMDTDPATLDKISARMDLYYEMIKHFRVETSDELVERRNDIRQRLGGTGADGLDLGELEQQARAEAKVVKALADRVTESRRAGAQRLAEQIERQARPLGLPNLTFEVEITTGKLNATGQDEVRFLCSFNRGGSLQPLADVASGGEISRMMLSLKAILSDKISMPTIIFDEVDTGVSGEIADKMGEMMRRMGANMQVISITHLPQVAAKGHAHFKVYKRDEEEKTVTHVRRLSDEERVRELAAMMSGSDIGEAALDNARALLSAE